MKEKQQRLEINEIENRVKTEKTNKAKDQSFKRLIKLINS